MPGTLLRKVPPEFCNGSVLFESGAEFGCCKTPRFTGTEGGTDAAVSRLSACGGQVAFAQSANSDAGYFAAQSTSGVLQRFRTV
jgi:hypothetical protein